MDARIGKPVFQARKAETESCVRNNANEGGLSVNTGDAMNTDGIDGVRLVRVKTRE
jgi:hypothetical protein